MRGSQLGWGVTGLAITVKVAEDVGYMRYEDLKGLLSEEGLDR